MTRKAAGGMAGGAAVRGFDARRLWQAVAACSWVTLTVLSLLPGADRPHTGLSGDAEHGLAYLLAAGVTRFAFPRTTSRRQLLAFGCAAALFEIAQIWIPGRHAGVDNWAASSAGALAGIVGARGIVHRREQRGMRRRSPKSD